MIKRKKDGGFTLIELMIVIAVIGILAVVLAPKFGEVRDDAKTAGLETNLHSVQLYIETNIEKWKSDALFDAENEVAAYLVTNLVTTENMANPYGNTGVVLAGPVPGSGFDPVKGAIYVDVEGSGSTYKITLTGINNKGVTHNRAITITP